MRVSKIREHLAEIFVLFLGSIFGFLLMFGTFTKQKGTLYIATKAWSDFASHIPLIRSFSLGSNFPPQYPIFPNEPIKYHFLFYSLVGLLEKMGIRIDISLNLVSFIGFVLLVFMIYYFAKELFKSKAVGVISAVFFLFNSSLSFIYFFRKYPLNSNSIVQIFSNKDFMSFAPYGQGLITAFWNLNIFTNQRHLALSLGLSLLLIYLVMKPILGKNKLKIHHHILLGILFGFSFYLHTAVFIMTAVVLTCFIVAFPKIRKQTFVLLFLSLVIALPQYLYSRGSGGFSPILMFGYLVSNPTLPKLGVFWIYNLGLSLLLIPLGFIFSNKTQRKVLISFLFLFIIGITTQFSPEIAANHKFFNYFIIVGNMFSAFSLYILWKKKNILKPLVAIVFFFMIFGGIIDLFPILNDGKVAIADYEKNSTASWIKNNTPKNSVFLNTDYLYDSASLAGRKIFLGWPYFSWSQGYNTDSRGNVMNQILSSSNLNTFCKLTKKNNISYVEINLAAYDEGLSKPSDIYKNFKSVYHNSLEQTTVYNVSDLCSKT